MSKWHRFTLADISLRGIDISQEDGYIDFMGTRKRVKLQSPIRPMFLH